MHVIKRRVEFDILNQFVANISDFPPADNKGGDWTVSILGILSKNRLQTMANHLYFSRFGVQLYTLLYPKAIECFLYILNAAHLIQLL